MTQHYVLNKPVTDWLVTRYVHDSNVSAFADTTINVVTVQKPCSAAKLISKTVVENYSHLKSVIDNLHLEGGSVDLLIGTDFPAAFIDVHIQQGEQQEPIAKRNCFGWYILRMINNENNDNVSKLFQLMWVP